MEQEQPRNHNDLLIRSAVRQAGAEPIPPCKESIDTWLSAGHLAERGISDEAMQRYREAFDLLTVAVRTAEAAKVPPIHKLHEVAARLVELLGRDRGILGLAMDRTPNFSFRQHSVNVALIGSRIAQCMGWAEKRVVAVALAGLVHDIGTVRLPKKLMFKEAWTPADRLEVEKRPFHSSSILSGVSGYEWLPIVVEQVYERENGHGYPRRLTSSAILDEAKVLGVADVFEACLHRRPQRGAMTGYQALEVITSEKNTFSEAVTGAMIRAFSVYPINEPVVLNTGEVGEVTSINEHNPLRPVVRLVHAVDGSVFRENIVVDLADHPEMWICSAVVLEESRAH